jgi:hypothetical protein
MRLIIQSILLPANVHKKMLPLIRIIIPATAIFYIIHLLSAISFSAFYQTIIQQPPVLWSAIVICLLLMPVNWGIETVKWKRMASKLQPISWQSTAQSVLYGISLGMVTPKRTGEFAGRILFLSPQNRMKGLLLNSVNSLSQLLVTLVVGCLAVWVMSSGKSFPNKYLFGDIGINTFAVAGLIAVMLIIISVFLLSKLKLVNIFSLAKIFTRVTIPDLMVLLGLSFCRYVVFVLQFILLLHMMGVNMPFPLMGALIAVIYLLMTLIPLSAILELPVRGSVAIFVFSLYSNSNGIEASILAATAILWVINLALPALAGSLVGLHREVNLQSSSDE